MTRTSATIRNRLRRVLALQRLPLRELRDAEERGDMLEWITLSRRIVEEIDAVPDAVPDDSQRLVRRNEARWQQQKVQRREIWGKGR